MSPGPLRLTRSDPAIVILSINRCHPVTQCCETPSSFISFVYLSYPLLVVCSAPLLFRTRSVGFSTGNIELLSTFRCYGHTVRFDSFIGHLIRRKRQTTLMHGTFSYSRPISRCVDVVDSTLDCRTESDFDEESQRGSPLRRSVDFIEELQCAHHCRSFFFSVSKGNDFNEDRMDTITFEVHEKELDADRTRTVADELEEEEGLLCDLYEFVLVESCSEDRLLPCYFYSL